MSRPLQTTLTVLWAIVLPLTAAEPAPDDASFHARLAQSRVDDLSHLTGLAEATLKTSPGDPFALFVLAQSQLEGGALAASLRGFQRTASLFHERPEPLEGSQVHWPSLVQYRIASCFGAMARPAEEQRCLEAYLAQGFDRHEQVNLIQSPAITQLINSHVKTGHLTQAREWLQQAGERGVPRLDMEWVRLELYEDRTGETASARLQRLIRSAGGLGSSAVPLEWTLYSGFLSGYLGDRAAALTASRIAIEQGAANPAVARQLSPPPRLDLAQLQLGGGDFAGARASLEACAGELGALTQLAYHDSKKHLQLRTAQWFLATGHPEAGWEICRALLKTPVRFGSGTLRNAVSWRAGMNLTALCSLELAESTASEWIPRQVLRSQLRAALYRELDALIGASGNELDLFTAVDVPIWMWPHLREATGPLVIRGLKSRFGLHGKRAERYGPMIDRLSDLPPGPRTGESAPPPDEALAREVWTLWNRGNGLARLRLPTRIDLNPQEIRRLQLID